MHRLAGAFILLFSIASWGSLGWDTEWYNLYSQRSLKESNLDPTNRYLNYSKSTYSSDYRFNMIYLKKKKWKAVFRPRILVEQSSYSYLNPSERKSKTTATPSASEAWISANVSRDSSWTVGLQNFQWGPAEVISPSNIFYHFNSNQKSTTYKSTGRNLIRYNWTPSEDFSLVAIIEPTNNGESHWIYNQKFKPKAEIKIEKVGSNSLNYWGLGAGLDEEQVPVLAQYANYEFRPGWSLYFDAKETNGSANYLAEANSLGLYDMVYSKRDGWQSLGVYGVRWESDWDIRYEFIANSFGLSSDQQTQAFISALDINPSKAQNLYALRESGRELFGKYYSYLSFFKRDFIKRDFNLGLRYFHSHQDQSGSLQSNFDAPLSNSLTYFLDLILYLGTVNQEISAFETNWISTGIKWSF